MRGILGHGTHLPHRRLDRTEITRFLGAGGGRGTRTVASYDEDSVTLAVEAARTARRGLGDHLRIDALWWASVTPPYLDRTNATTVHAALRLDGDVMAADAIGSARAGAAVARTALEGSGTVLLTAADLRTGLPGSADEASGGDAGAALVIGDGDDGSPVLAEYLGGASATDEFLDRWRVPGEARSRLWEEKFGEVQYLPLGESAWTEALKAAELTAAAVDRVVLTGPHPRAAKGLARRLGVADGALVDDLASTVGWTGAAHPFLLLSGVLDDATAGDVVALVSLADGADVLLFRVTVAGGVQASARPLAGQVAAGASVPYGKFLVWRGMLTVEPPRRPEPARPSSSAAARADEWKYGFVGSRDRASGAVHLPPSRVSMVGGAVDDMEPVPMADVEGTIATFTVDRLAYSPSPPVVFAVVDFDGGGRLPVELTDVDVDEVAIGGRVEMTFRRLFTADGIHNYFWKARPVGA